MFVLKNATATVARLSRIEYALWLCYHPRLRTSHTMVSLPSSLDLKVPCCALRKFGIPEDRPGVSHQPGCMELMLTFLCKAAHRSVSVTCARFVKA